jgi:hypothetical protein
MWTKLQDPIEGILTFTTQQYDIGTYVIINGDPAKQFASKLNENEYHCKIRLRCLKRGGKILNGDFVKYKGKAALNKLEELIEDVEFEPCTEIYEIDKINNPSTGK